MTRNTGERAPGPLSVFVSGPEKVGKSTLMLGLRAYDTITRVIHHSYAPSTVLERQWRTAAWEAVCGCVGIDRGWLDGQVYDQILGRAGGNLFVNEWRFGAPGPKLVLVPNERLAPETDDDHHIPYDVERAGFVRWAAEIGWKCVTLPELYLTEVVAELQRWAPVAPIRDVYWGPPNPRVLIVAEARNEVSLEPAPLGTRLFWFIPEGVESAIQWVGRTNSTEYKQVVNAIGDVPVITLGKEAEKVVGASAVENFQHPAAIMRWGQYSDERASYVDAVNRAIRLATKGK